MLHDNYEILYLEFYNIWGEDSVCDRGWLLQNMPGVTALIVLVTDKVSHIQHKLQSDFIFLFRLMLIF